MYTGMQAFNSWSTILEDSTIPKFPNLSRATVAGISVAIAGNVLISFALNCQKLAHGRLERDRELARGQIKKDQRGDPVKAKRNGIATLIAEEEDDGRDDSGAGQHYGNGETENSAESPTMAVLETQPLLARSGATNDVNALSPSRAQKVSLLTRINPWGRKPTHTQSQSAHSLLPVDILTVRPSNTTDQEQQQSGTGQGNDGNESDYLRSKLWWLGFALMNIGEIGNFISYGFAPASIVAPLGTFALIANCVFAPLLLKERFRKRDFLGIMVAIVGAVTVVLSANPSDTKLDPDGLIHAISQRVFIVYSVVYVIAAIVLSLLSEGSTGRKHVFVDVGLCAIFGGFTVLSTKAISTLLTKEWLQIFTEWITWPAIAILLGTGVGQIRYLNRALMRFDSKIVVPTQFVMFNLSAIVGSAILYGDFKRASFHQIVTFLYGCAATFAGVFIIAWAPDGYDRGVGDAEDNRADDMEAVLTNAEDTETPREVRMGSLSRRDRPTLVVPENVADNIAGTPILRNKQSLVSLIGLSPAQRVLLVHTPPRDGLVRPLPYGNDSDLASESHRRRTISWIEGGPAGRARGRRTMSNVGSRETSISRTSANCTSRSPRG